ncbi:hypothetical protein ABZX92_22940 [Lentzea sp. NPDC006480]|uniref:hypothetical protein n=1 Tax=Lentzea sp. NPDC006480 TaxID=3157176 RepID=UPI00339E65AC
MRDHIGKPAGAKKQVARAQQQAPPLAWVERLQRQVGNASTTLAVQRAIARMDEAASRSLTDISPADATRLVAELGGSPTSLAQFGPRRCLLHLMQEVAAGTQTVTREQLDRRSDRYAPLVVVRPDGYWANALTGQALQRAFSAERAASPPYEIGRFYYSRGGVMYRTDDSLQASGQPIAELGLEHDVAGAALDGVEDAAVAMARGLVQLITHPVRTIAGLANLPAAVAQLITQSPEYWEMFRAMPLNDQVRSVSELVSTLVLMYGTAAGSATAIAAAAGDAGEVAINVLRLQSNGSLAVAQVTVPVGTVATAMSGGPGAIYVLAMANSAAGGSGGGGGGGGNPPEFIEAVRALDKGDAAARVTDVQRAALEWNARQIASTTGVPLTSGRIAWRSLWNQLSRPRWRFLDQVPEAARTLRDMVNGLPDGPYAAADPTKAQLAAKLATWLP